MPKNLVIVESPSKTKPIEKYLGSDYKVLSSKGHVRDLATTGKYGFGVDVDHDFKPNYIMMSGKKNVVNELKKALKDASHVYLATDPDREGEAISWHLKDVLNLDDKDYDRVVFNEITKNAVVDAFKHTRKIDDYLVNSQETRRILDRIIGFRLSKLIQSKTNGSSAGRVQSVALKLIVEKEREIEAFIPEEYYKIKAIFDNFESELFNYDNKDFKISSKEENDKVLNNLGEDFKVVNIEKKEKQKQARMPYITSTLQQDASNKLNFNSKKTMQIAQKLYEGMELEDETVGLITYMRTDSTRLSDDFVKSVYGYIKENYGEEYIGYVKKSKKKDNVQDAHEAIRPTSINRTPEEVRKYLTNDEFKLYRMIYYRALASLFANAKTLNTTIILDNNNYQFKTTGQIVTFDGYLKIYSDYEDSKDTIVPDLKENSVFKANDIESTQTMDIIKKRGYVVIEDKKFVPTKIGIEITDKLQQHFSHLINVEYTANMENDLDKIAEGKENYIETLKKFYNEFEPSVKKAFDEMPKKEAEKTGEDCPECGSSLVIRHGKYGDFTACSNFPKCKYIKSEPKEIVVACKCPNCDGDIIEKRSKRGKIFYGCNNYPKCKTAYWDKPTGNLCKECNSMLTIKGKNIKCSNCDYKEIID